MGRGGERPPGQTDSRSVVREPMATQREVNTVDTSAFVAEKTIHRVFQHNDLMLLIVSSVTHFPATS